MDWPLLVGGIGAAIGGLAAAVKGVLYLWARGQDALSWLAMRKRTRAVLEDLATSEGWPNGASSLKESHADLYQAVKGIQLSVSEIQRAIETLHGPHWDER